MSCTCIYYPFRSPPPDGFSDHDSEDQLFVVFRAFIYKEAWPGWNEDALVYMRFGGENFGDFKYDVGPGEIERYVVGYNYWYKIKKK